MTDGPLDRLLARPLLRGQAAGEPRGGVKDTKRVSTIYNQIADALAADARRAIAEARLADMERPLGTQAIDIDFYSAKDREASVDDARWCVTLVRWNGKAWQRARKLTGPLTFEAVVVAAGEAAAKRTLPRI